MVHDMMAMASYEWNFSFIHQITLVLAKWKPGRHGDSNGQKKNNNNNKRPRACPQLLQIDPPTSGKIGDDFPNDFFWNTRKWTVSIQTTNVQ